MLLFIGIALYVALEGLAMLLFPRASRRVALRLLGQPASLDSPPGTATFAKGVLVSAAGLALFLQSPDEGPLAVALPLAATPLFVYGALAAMLGEGAKRGVRELYEGYSAGQLKTLGLCELALGLSAALAALAYLQFS